MKFLSHTLWCLSFSMILAMFCAGPTTALAEDSKNIYVEDFQAAKSLQKALKNNDKNAVARLVRYPIVREYPLPPIKSASDLIGNWDDFFDKENISEIVAATPTAVGYRGVTLGDLWFDGGKVIALNLRTAAFAKKVSEAKNKEFLTLHPSVRGYKKVAVRCSTGSKSIRIQEHGDGYHYFVWKKGGGLLEKPELALKGTVEFQGSGGGQTYTFKNHGYSYVFSAPVVCRADACDDTLTVLKGEKELSKQICK